MATIKLTRTEEKEIKKEAKEFVRSFISTVAAGNDREINELIHKGFTIKNLVNNIFSERGEYFVNTTVVFTEREV